MVRNSIGHMWPAASEMLLLRTMLLLACGLGMMACSNSGNKNIKFHQYYVQGEQLYTKHCSNCHQKNGSGLGRVYPPLNTSDYMQKNLDEVLCQMKYGKKGEIRVNGITYNMEMKGVISLTELELAEIATYIYNSWDHQTGIIEIDRVEKALAKCQPE
ncbi:MAG: c-type cytochrome [Flammeovirgaceae bacterium]